MASRVDVGTAPLAACVVGAQASTRRDIRMADSVFSAVIRVAAVVVRVLRVGAPLSAVHEASLSLAVREQRWWAVLWRGWQLQVL